MKSGADSNKQPRGSVSKSASLLPPVASHIGNVGQPLSSATRWNLIQLRLLIFNYVLPARRYVTQITQVDATYRLPLPFFTPIDWLLRIELTTFSFHVFAFGSFYRICFRLVCDQCVDKLASQTTQLSRKRRKRKLAQLNLMKPGLIAADSNVRSCRWCLVDS